MTRQIVIAFEGIDGSGKTVQMKRLERIFIARGKSVLTRSFPVYSSFFGERIGNLLSGTANVRADQVDAKSMALWFAMDRWADFQDRDTSNADVLLINRYVLSNAVYQSIRERDLSEPDILDWVFELEYKRLSLPEPDVHVVLDVLPQDAGHNVDKKGFREYVGDARDVYESAGGIQARAREKYLDYARRCSNILVVDCMDQGALLPEDEVFFRIESALSEHGILNS